MTTLYLTASPKALERIAGAEPGAYARLEAAYQAYRTSSDDEEIAWQAHEEYVNGLAPADATLYSLMRDALGRFHGWSLVDRFGLRGEDSTGSTDDRDQMIALIEAQRPSPNHGTIRIGGTAAEWAASDAARNRLIDAVIEAVRRGDVSEIYWA